RDSFVRILGLQDSKETLRMTPPISRRAFTASILGSAVAGGAVVRAARLPPPMQRASSLAGADALTSLTLAEVSARIRSGAVPSTELVNACLARITVYNPKVNAFITVMSDAALAQAKVLDAEQKAGKLRGPLHGIPIALKDNIDTAGTRTTAASAVFDERVPTEDAE